MRMHSGAEVLLAALLSACSGTDCGVATELEAGEPCLKLFTYCPKDMNCCLAAGSRAPVCAPLSECRQGGFGEICGYNYLSPNRGAANGCVSPLTCEEGRCACAPRCYGWTACVQDEERCLYSCCPEETACVAGECVPTEHDRGLRRRDAGPEGRLPDLSPPLPEAGLDLHGQPLDARPDLPEQPRDGASNVGGDLVPFHEGGWP